MSSKFHLKKQYIGGEVINTAINTESCDSSSGKPRALSTTVLRIYWGENLDAQPDFWQGGTSSFVIGTSFNAFYGPD